MTIFCRVLMVYPKFIELVLELYGSLRIGRREVSGRAARPDHGRRHAAEALGTSVSSTVTPSL